MVCVRYRQTAAAAAATVRLYLTTQPSGSLPRTRIAAIRQLWVLGQQTGVVRLSCADRLTLPALALPDPPLSPGLVPKSTCWSCYRALSHHLLLPPPSASSSKSCPDIFCLLQTQTSVEHLSSL